MVVPEPSSLAWEVEEAEGRVINGGGKCADKRCEIDVHREHVDPTESHDCRNEHRG